jgi:hypothetical protein
MGHVFHRILKISFVLTSPSLDDFDVCLIVFSLDFTTAKKMYGKVVFKNK